ncbi:hypothetical protein [Levilactobacillus bambusae]|uniref:Uncharacterized protein n=1 Tax=Levilactobacillus bambusae TaxID=2024736 RepID=A0A2V1N181_9LACO|nr:hypothetical protein [Levilactobacillus bambusae]PWG00974.1 hypothetical protein DCM90_02020 [Levilactobacillus bambusae]
MNYLLQIKAFYDRLEINPLNSSEIALWHALMSINNKTAWSDTFTVASSVLCQKAGLKDTSKSSSFYSVRNGLVQKGYVEWESRKGQQSAKYRIINLYEHLSTNSVDNTVDNRVGNSVDNRVALTKQNKTKQNKESLSKPKTGSTRKTKLYASDSPEIKAARYLFTKVKANNPKAKAPDYQKWAAQFHLIFDRDHRTHVEVGQVIDWCQADDFWKFNILSPAKLRKQFDQLEPKMKQTTGRISRPKEAEDWVKTEEQPTERKWI